MPIDSRNKRELSPGDLALESAFQIGAGAIVGGLSGVVGRLGVSFFSPATAVAVGSSLNFMAVGAVAAPLAVLPSMLIDYLMNKNSYLNKHPFVKETLKDASKFLLTLGAVTAAAAMLATPIGPTVICMMVIPAIYYVLKSICNLVNYFNKTNEAEFTQAAPAPTF